MLGRVYDAVLFPFEVAQLRNLRHEILRHAHGRTLEIGAGTGLNFPYYPKDVTVTASDPDEQMLERAEKRIRDYQIIDRIRAVRLDAQELPFEDEEFDTVVATLVFCSIPEPEKALREVFRVLKGGGRFLLLEHVRKNTPVIGGIQDVLTPVWRLIAGNCHLNRDPEREIARLGFRTLERHTLWKGVGKIWILEKPRSGQSCANAD